MTTCSIPDCEEPPTDQTTMWAVSTRKTGFPMKPEDIFVVSVSVCAAHKRENEAHG